MEIRHTVSPIEAKHFDTHALRKAFLISDLFVPDEIKMVYSHVDRIIAAGVCPLNSSLALEGGKDIGSDTFLERRELGIINIGAKGTVAVDGTEYILDHRDGLYIGMGAKDVVFSSENGAHPAKFYGNSTPAHACYSTAKISIDEAQPIHLGSKHASNTRTIYQYVHPDRVQSCQLLMGMTILEPENVWNTMPCHTHERRMEIYFYWDLPEQGTVFHLMGEPEETRHLVVRNEQAVISPSWSIHSGVGTTNYTFIWGMAGENQTFTDMDTVPMNDLR